ncbi:MAG TPA: hypothetical protein DD491_15745, partial [Halieaceae bacterium]|nr:hypothetical protein [Halieaceae bacterium]
MTDASATPHTASDAEILAAFHDEATDLLAALREQVGEEAGTVEAERLLHSLKGAARAARLDAMADLAHTLEDALAKDGIAALGDGLDALDAALARIAPRSAPSAATRDRLRAFLGDAESLLAAAAADTRQGAFAASLRYLRDIARGARLYAFAADVARHLAPLERDDAAGGRDEIIAHLRDALAQVAATGADLAVPEGEGAGGRSAVALRVRDLGGLLREATDTRQAGARTRRQVSQILGHLQATQQRLGYINTQVARASVQPRHVRERQQIIDDLLGVLGEGLTDLAALNASALRAGLRAETALSQQAHVLDAHGAALEAAQLVPASRVADALRHTVVQEAREAAKEVSLESHCDGLLERHQAERLRRALDHLLRNAVIHGIEPPAQRRAQDKSALGVIRLVIQPRDGDLEIRVSDDGAGIDRERLQQIAEARGLLPDGGSLRDQELLALVFERGLSTAASVSGAAGRGVGTGAARAEILALGGTIAVASRAGEGTTFSIRVPSAAPRRGAFVATAGDQAYALLPGSLGKVHLCAWGEFEEACRGGTLTPEPA